MRPANQVPRHWSKDFVEHLRTVHFALMAISAGLLLLVLSAREYNAVAALVQIEEIISLKSQWSVRWILDHAQRNEPYVKANIPPSDNYYGVSGSDNMMIGGIPIYGNEDPGTARIEN